MHQDKITLLIFIYVITNLLAGFTLREYFINLDYQRLKKKKQWLSVNHYKQSNKYRKHRSFYNNLIWQGWLALIFIIPVWVLSKKENIKPGK